MPNVIKITTTLHVKIEAEFEKTTCKKLKL
jgi:hypothetical protein